MIALLLYIRSLYHGSTRLQVTRVLPGWTFMQVKAVLLGGKHGRWIGRWLHGIPTKGMIYKLFVVVAGFLMGLGFGCIEKYYVPISGILIGLAGVVMFLLWGIAEDDV